MKDKFKKIGLVIIAFFLALQFIQLHNNHANSTQLSSISNVVNLPPQIAQTLQTSCYDCHSNNTNYPWYSYIQPIGFWINHHINEGKEELNFDEFANYKPKKQLHKLEEIIEMVEVEAMPLASYTTMHKQAVLSTHQKQLLLIWAKNSLNLISNSVYKTP